MSSDYFSAQAIQERIAANNKLLGINSVVSEDDPNYVDKSKVNETIQESKDEIKVNPVLDAIGSGTSQSSTDSNINYWNQNKYGSVLTGSHGTGFGLTGSNLGITGGAGQFKFDAGDWNFGDKANIGTKKIVESDDDDGLLSIASDDKVTTGQDSTGTDSTGTEVDAKELAKKKAKLEAIEQMGDAFQDIGSEMANRDVTYGDIF